METEKKKKNTFPWVTLPVTVATSAEKACWLRLLVSESMWRVVRLATSCSSALWWWPEPESTSVEDAIPVSVPKPKSIGKRNVSIWKCQSRNIYKRDTATSAKWFNINILPKSILFTYHSGKYK